MPFLVRTWSHLIWEYLDGWNKWTLLGPASLSKDCLDYLTKVKLGKPTIKPSLSHQYEKSRSCLSCSGPAPFSPEDNIKKEIAEQNSDEMITVDGIHTTAALPELRRQFPERDAIALRNRFGYLKRHGWETRVVAGRVAPLGTPQTIPS